MKKQKLTYTNLLKKEMPKQVLSAALSNSYTIQSEQYMEIMVLGGELMEAANNEAARELAKTKIANFLTKFEKDSIGTAV